MANGLLLTLPLVPDLNHDFSRGKVHLCLSRSEGSNPPDPPFWGGLKRLRCVGSGSGVMLAVNYCIKLVDLCSPPQTWQ